MTWDRGVVIDHQLVSVLRRSAEASASGRPRRGRDEPMAPASTLTGALFLELLESQFTSRHLDLIARELRSRDAAFYTIGSSGHEGNAVVGALGRAHDPFFLHYRSGALMVQHLRQDPEADAIRDVLLAQAAAASDPVAGGRHKVWGSRKLFVPPQTSTIASHLPKAVGAAIALGRARRCADGSPLREDSVIVCTFGDASLNHSTAQGALNATSWAAHQKIPVPALFVCEDNGIGVSVHTPEGWVEATMASRPGIAYFRADGLDLVDAFVGAERALAHVRRTRQPAFLHLSTVRLLGHAGSDIEQGYHTIDEIEATEARDPLIASSMVAIETGLLDAEGVLALYEGVRKRVRDTAEEILDLPKLETPEEIMAPLAPLSPAALREECARPAPEVSSAWLAPTKREGAPRPLRPLEGARHMAVLVNRGLHEALVKYPEAMAFGEDVAQKGGVYGVTHGLWRRFGGARVFNTLLDETSILGMAIGAAQLGMLPIPEIQYLAYVHNAEDQLRSEACSQQFFSQGQFSNGMVVRLAGLAYQKGFGGHFHNDNSVAVLRDMPGLVLACPSRGDDAVRMLRTCLALAKVDGRVSVFLEPIALYMTRDLHEPGDRLWTCRMPGLDEHVAPGEPRIYGDDSGELTITTYGNGVPMALRAARRLHEESGVRASVLDLRWLSPLPVEALAALARPSGRVLVVDECRRAGGLGEAIIAGLVERGFESRGLALLAAHDTYVPLGPAMYRVMPSDEDVLASAHSLLGLS